MNLYFVNNTQIYTYFASIQTKVHFTLGKKHIDFLKINPIFVKNIMFHKKLEWL